MLLRTFFRYKFISNTDVLIASVSRSKITLFTSYFHEKNQLKGCELYMDMSSLLNTVHSIFFVMPLILAFFIFINFLLVMPNLKVTAPSLQHCSPSNPVSLE